MDQPRTAARVRAGTIGFAWLTMLGLLSSPLCPGQDFYPLKDIRPGLHGVGRTVFAGNRIEEFQVEILGVIENSAPQQSIILAKLTGGPLAETGILQGMSGSPVYIDGKLAGAVALGFPFSKEPITGIQPIEQMIADARFPSTASRASRAPVIAVPRDSPNPLSQLADLKSPLFMSGFTAGTLATFGPELGKFGFAPLQGVSAGSPKSPQYSGTVQPGSMISVQLMSGDMAVGADGTVTYVDGKRVYAFGHRFLDTGSTELPFARAEVIALLPALNSSFKISTPREWVGTMVSDRSTAIAGEIGRSAHMVPVTISLHPDGAAVHDYRMNVVNDRLLTAFLTQMALYSSLDATERTTGAATIRLRGKVEFENNLPPVIIRDTFISDNATPAQAAANAVVILGFVMSAGFSDLHVKSVSYEVEPSETKNQLQIDQVWTSRRQVKPGDDILITTLLTGENGVEITRESTYRVPIGAQPGPLNFTVSDANTLNFPEFAGLNPAAMHSAQQLISIINQYRGSDNAFVRVWRQEPTYTVGATFPGGDLTDPPPSAALILAQPSASASGSILINNTRGAQLAEIAIPLSGYAVSGAKTVQVEVKE
ncbi:MAG TPA: SpoIVB peptidase S55 domain-containing protein [Bryobacteraceae bacterium]|nr:SpoIVB peptidase S55 domain-containing protein [Bryobacteraceae bacterium]